MIDPLKKDLKILNKNNLLIKANYNLSFVENKFYLTILFNMQKTARGTYIGTISKEEFLGLSKKTANNTSVGVDRILESLANKRVQIQEFKKQNKKPAEYDFPIITGHKFNPEDNTYTIELSTILYDLLLEYMEVGYTPLNLGVMLGLNNFYAQRLYELLRLWSSSKEVITYKVDYLRECFNLEDKYSKYTDFRKRVIDPALKALNSTEKFKITYEELKSGRNVDSITFIVEDLDKRKYFDKNDIKEVVECEENGNNKGLELIKEEKCINTLSKQKETLKIENKEFYVPDETVFTKGTLRSFKLDFAHIDFKDDYMKRAFNDAVMIALDRDDVETIKATSYKFFKGTLDNKIIEYQKEKEEDIKHKQEMDIFW